MSSPDSGFNDNGKVFNEDVTSSDGYGGMAPYIYDAITAYKKCGVYPRFCDLKENRNAHFHWRTRCKNFSLTDAGVLLYSGNNSSTARAVVRLGETRLAIKFIHEKIGHAGQKQTVVACSRRLYWRSMRRDVSRLLTECHFCSHRKAIRKNDLQLSEIGRAPSLHSPLAEESAMRAIAERLLLNTDDNLGGELGQFYRTSELAYVVYEDDESSFNLGGMEAEEEEEVERIIGEEESVSRTLAEMSGAYMVVQQDEDMKGHEELVHSDFVVEEVERRHPRMLIVPDDVVPAASNEIVHAADDQQKASTSGQREMRELRGDKEEEEEEEWHEQLVDDERAKVEIKASERRDERVEEAEERQEGRTEGRTGEASRKRRGCDVAGRLMEGLRFGGSGKTKKKLHEENIALRFRLSQMEAAALHEGTGVLASVAMQMPPVDEEVAAIQKNLLLIQREVLMLQRVYWQSKMQLEGYHMQLAQLYDHADDAASAAAVEEEYEEVDEEEVSVSRHPRVLHDAEEEEAIVHRG